MSDARLREAERRWRETGAVEDEAVYLHERVRAGELEPPRLRRAAPFSAAARLALERMREAGRAHREPAGAGAYLAAVGDQADRVRVCVAAVIVASASRGDPLRDFLRALVRLLDATPGEQPLLPVVHLEWSTAD